jgi:hypothetical protein
VHGTRDGVGAACGAGEGTWATRGVVEGTGDGGAPGKPAEKGEIEIGG